MIEMNIAQIIDELKSKGDKKNIEGMARFGIKSDNNLGNSVTFIRNFARKIGKNHDLALELWKTGIRDARMLAACIDEIDKVTEPQLDNWVKDFDSWDICDHCCGHLFERTSHCNKKIIEWSKRKEEFVKRAAFALIAWSAVHDKKSDNTKFEKYLKIIIRESNDERNYVKKAVNWGLRNIGKRNLALNKKAIQTSKEILKLDTKTARWIANDAIRELSSEKIQNRFKKNP